MNDLIYEQAGITLTKFIKRVLPIPWEPRGILTSEGFAFCVLCDLYKINAVVESGIWNGRSTKMWARFIDGQVTAIDWDVHDDARDDLAMCPNVSILEGDATQLLLSEVSKQTERTAVFIDGPKGDTALVLAIEAMKWPCVQFVGIHDMSVLVGGIPNRTRQQIETNGHVWFTDDKAFCNIYSWLDDDDSQLDTEQGTRWTPGIRHEEGKCDIPYGSYGYTIGFLLREM